MRHQVDVQGDFALIGNTLAQECGNNPPDPTKGFVACNTQNEGDTAPDLFWVSDFKGIPPLLGLLGGVPAGPTALGQFTSAQANSVAVLQLPAGATVVYARLYWGAEIAADGADYDHNVTVGRAQGFTQTVTADAGFTTSAETGATWYQSTADVTAIVQANGVGAYRISDVTSRDIVNLDDETSFAAWSLVVFYDDGGATKRNLALFDGFDIVDVGKPATATISGFQVPDAGFDAKLGVVAYEGDNILHGDALTFNGTALTDGENAADNFFNSTRSNFGAAVSNAGDLPRLKGTPGSMSGVDLDVVDIHALVKAKDTSATFTATSTQDRYVLGAFITSIATFKPDFSKATTKTVTNVTHSTGDAQNGDVLTYTINTINNGNDAAIHSVLSDPLPNGVTYQAGTLKVTDETGTSTPTDAVDGDRGDYDASTRTVSAFVGVGAADPTGGKVGIGKSASLSFQVKIDADFHGAIDNQGTITAAGEQGAPTTGTATDGDPTAPGTQPTTIEIPGCSTNTDCGTKLCDTTTGACVDCLGPTDCRDPSPICDPTEHTCVACDANTDCAAPTDLCDTATHTCVDCVGNSDCRLPTDICDPKDNTCVVCTTNTDCPAGDQCDLGTRTCVQCLSSTDCSGTTPICSPTGTCVQCVDNTGCTAPQICNTAAGTCASNVDTDGDGLPDAVELSIGTDPNDADSDDDGVPDGQEKDPGLDTDGDGLINALDPDSDNDGILDGTEQGKDCSSPATDNSKHHCRADADPTTTTDPEKADTDGGGVRDGSEDWNLNGKVDAGETDPNAAADDGSVVDTDGDGLGDKLEGFLHSDPNSADSDGDGLPDGEEANPSDDTDGDGLINLLDVDSDNDALYDGTESGKGCAAGAKHCIPDGDLGATKTYELVADTDHGGVKDGSEDFNRNGVVDSGETDPTVGHGADDGMVVDTDGDGLSDGLEQNLGSSPTSADSDGDGLPDGQEPNPADDADGDGTVNLLDTDSDNDGIFDGTEAGKTCPAGADASKCITDADPSTTTSVINADTDFGGEKDGDEDPNHNGKIDAGEKNPNDPTDDSSTTGGGGNGSGGNTTSTGGNSGTTGGNSGTTGGNAGNSGTTGGNSGTTGGNSGTTGGNSGTTGGAGGKAGNSGTTGGNSGTTGGNAGNSGTTGGNSGTTGGNSGATGGNGSGANNGAGGGAPDGGVDGTNILLEGGCSVGDQGGDSWALGLIALAGLAAKKRSRKK